MEEAILLDMTSEDGIKIEDNPNPFKTEKFCTEWACVKKLVKIITLEGEKVTVEEIHEKKLIEEDHDDSKNI